MSFRLSGWQRLGVASVLWAIGAGLAMRIHYAGEAHNMYQLTYENCYDHKKDFLACSDEAFKADRLALESSWGSRGYCGFSANTHRVAAGLRSRLDMAMGEAWFQYSTAAAIGRPGDFCL